MSPENPCPMPALNTGKPEISMAPLVDIVFLLLIFFMVTTVFPDSDGLLIEKPASENAAPMSGDQIIIKLDREGAAYFNGQPVTTDDIKRMLETELAIKPESAVTIHADRLATTESLIDVIDAAKAGGAKQLGIATDEKRD